MPMTATLRPDSRDAAHVLRRQRQADLIRRDLLRQPMHRVELLVPPADTRAR